MLSAVAVLEGRGCTELVIRWALIDLGNIKKMKAAIDHEQLQDSIANVQPI